MTIEQREKIQHAIQALIDVESALHSTDSGQNSALSAVEAKLHDARSAMVELNAPDYN